MTLSVDFWFVFDNIQAFMATHVLLTNLTRYCLQTRGLKQWVRFLMQVEGPRWDRSQRPIEILEIIHVGSYRMRQLKRYFFRKNQDTDVISLRTTPVSGCLYINLSFLEKQAKRMELSLVHEWGYMVIHGLLHLWGWDHQWDESKNETMIQIQRQIFARWSHRLRPRWIQKPSVDC